MKLLSASRQVAIVVAALLGGLGGLSGMGGMGGIGNAAPVVPGAFEYTLADSNARKAEHGLIVHTPRQGQPDYNGAIAHGQVHVHRYQSTALGVARELWLYTPPGYDASKDNYPLLVLQHAGADTEKTWVAKGNVDWLLDDLIAAGRARPMVVLMIAGHPRGESVYFKPETRVAAMHDLERELFDDAIPLVEANYRIDPSRELRSLAGPSVGGGQSFSIGLSNLDRFAWLGSFSGGHALPEFYQAALDTPQRTNAQLKLLWISCATGDQQFPLNQQLVSRLKASGVKHEWTPTEGAHSWPVWRRDLTIYLSRVFQPTNSSAVIPEISK